MKVEIKIKLLIIVTIFCIFSNFGVAKETIKIGVYENNPLIFAGEKKKAEGFVIDIIEKIAKKEKWKLEYIPCFFDEGLEKLKKNEIDILPMVAFSEERGKIYKYNKQNIITNWANVYIKKDSDIKELLDLEGKTIAGLKNDIHMDKLRQLGNQFNINFEILEKNSYHEVLELVANKKADVGVVNRFFGMKFGAKYDLQKSNIMFNPVAIYFAFPKNADQEFVERIDDNLKEMKTNKNSVYYISMVKWFENGRVGKNLLFSLEIVLLGIGMLLFFIYFLSRLSWIRRSFGLNEIVEERTALNILIIAFLIVVLFWFFRAFLDYKVNNNGERYIRYLLPLNSSYEMLLRVVLYLIILSSGIIISRIFTRLKKEQNSLRKITTYLEVTINSIGDAVIATDIDGLITIMNPVAEKMTGWAYEEAKNKSINEVFNIINSETKEKVENPIKKVLENGRMVGLTNHKKVISKTGKEYNIADSAAPIRENDGEILGAILVFHNVDKEYKMIEELQKSKIKAEKANQAKSDFLANMSHETRTPLNGIMGVTEILKDIEENEEKKEYLDMIYKSSLNLLNIVNNLLNLTNIEKNRVEIHNKNIKIYDVLEDIISIFKKECKKKNLEFKFQYDKSFPDEIEIDELLLIQILNNLLGNAIKFTKKGYVQWSVKNIENKKIEFIVMDTGIGINSEKYKRLFVPFEQGEYYLTKTYGGIGVSLAITEKLVKLMGGKIEVETQENKGTTFRVELPFQKIVKGKEVLKPKKEEIQFKKKKQLKILSAEDEKINQIILKKMVESQNWYFKDVYNGEELLKELEGNEYDIILMDIQLPKLNGLEATKEIKENKKFKNLKILGISAFALPGEIEKAMESGMDDYLIKPIELHEVIEKIDKLVQEEEEVCN